MTDNLILKLFYTTRLRRTIINKFEYNLSKYPNICRYLENRYAYFFSYRETLNRIYNKIEEQPICKYCGTPISSISGSSFCCNEHKILCRKEISKQTCLEKYGVDNVSKIPGLMKFVAKTVDYNKRQEKMKETLLNKYGIDNPGKLQSTIDASHTIDVINKQKESREITCLTKYGCKNSMQADISKESYKQTCLEKYGVDNYFKTQEFKDKLNWENILNKRYKTQKKNNSFNISTDEDICYNILLKYFPDIIRQYKSDKYPYNCDFYIPELDLYIEYNGSWTHGGHPFNENNKDDILLLEKWKNKNTDYYNNAIYTWTIRDINKRNIAKENNLNYIEFWNLPDVYKWLIDINKINIPLLNINYNINLFNSELQYYNNSNGNYNITYKNSDIIKYYQQDVFYKNEKELWNDNNIKVKLIYNRTSYLNKSINELTVEDILSGFKISGIYYGYSSFNPLWFKKFIEDNNIKICYDPCGGWGHRLLGSQLLEKYIYNDLSIDTYNNVNKIIHDLNIQNTITYNNDATTFIPTENYDAIFTCPPYYNIEEYSCGKFNSIDDYNKLIDNIFNCFYDKESCKILGIVIREDLLANKFNNYNTKICLSRKSSSHLNKGNKLYKEYLFIYNK